MTTVIEVPPGGLTDAICGAVMAMADDVEAGKVRISPHPLDPSTYLVLNDSCIVARLHVLDSDSMGPLDVE